MTNTLTLDQTLRAHRDLIPLKQLAKLLGMHYQTMYGMVREGRIPHIRLGSRILFEGNRIADWLDQRRVSYR